MTRAVRCRPGESAVAHEVPHEHQAPPLPRLLADLRSQVAAQAAPTETAQTGTARCVTMQRCNVAIVGAVSDSERAVPVCAVSVGAA